MLAPLAFNHSRAWAICALLESMPTTLPSGPTSSASKAVTMPTPQPRSATRIPRRRPASRSRRTSVVTAGLGLGQTLYSLAISLRESPTSRAGRLARHPRRGRPPHKRNFLGRQPVGRVHQVGDAPLQLPSLRRERLQRPDAPGVFVLHCFHLRDTQRPLRQLQPVQRRYVLVDLLLPGTGVHTLCTQALFDQCNDRCADRIVAFGNR
jgi:hypothetical protein